MRTRISKIISIIIFISGLINIFSSFLAKSHIRMEILLKIFPLGVTYASRTFTLIAGFFLLFLANGLRQQKKRAWLFSLIILLFSFFSHLLKGLDFEESLALLIPIVLLLIFRRAFGVKSGGILMVEGFKTLLYILFALFIYSFFGFYILQGQFNNQVNNQNIIREYEYSVFGVGKDVLVPQTKRALWFDDSLSVVGLTAILFALASLFSPLLDKDKLTKEDKNLIHDLLLKYSINSSDFLTLMEDKRYFIDKSKESFIAYKIASGAAVTLGEAIGDKIQKYNCIKNFSRDLNTRGIGLVMLNIPSESLKFYKSNKFHMIKTGDEAVIFTRNFNLSTSQLKDIRNSLNKILRLGVEFKIYRLSEIPWNIMVRVDKLHEEWLSSRRGPELTFSSDFYPLPAEEEGYLVVSHSPLNNILSAFSFFPYKYDNLAGYSLELMLRSKDSPNGIAEATLAKSIDFFANNGIEVVSLGQAPLSSIVEGKGNKIVQNTMEVIFERFNQFYGFKSLYNFKNKFNPTWIPKYVVYKGYISLPKTLLAILQVHIKEKNYFHLLLGRFKRKSPIE